MNGLGDSISFLDATAQAELVRRREISVAELVDDAIDRALRLNPRLNAIILPAYERARAHAKSMGHEGGPFHGVPFTFKDLGAHLADDPVHAGMGFLRNLGWTEPGETHLAAKLRRAGFVSLGRTNTPELGLLPTTEPIAYGPSRNPWDTTRSPGGSSGGAAVAVASGIVAVSHASDGGGSIRVPASACGLVGLKPSRGRCSFGAELGERWAGFSVEHVLTRSVRDTAAVLDATAGWMAGDPYTAPPPTRPFREEVGAPIGHPRVGLMTVSPSGVPVHSDCIQAVERTAALLNSLGCRVEHSYPRALISSEIGRALVQVIACSTAHTLDSWSRRTGSAITAADVEPLTWAVAELGRRTSATDYLKTLTAIQIFTRSIGAWWHEDGFDLLLTPTVAAPPPALGHFASPPDDPLASWIRAVPFSTFTSPFNATGQPAVSLPLWWNTEGLPIGTQLVAAYGREDLLLRIASQLEQALPWHHRRPVIHA